MANGHQVKGYIEQIIAEIGKCRREIEDKGKKKAAATKAYDMHLAIALATLRQAENYELAGKTYASPPVSIMDKIAKGICAMHHEELILAETGYRACLANLEALLAQLNAYQSVYRHAESMT
ncbi:MAG: hypothetical protein ACYTEO_15240 [Planctomycetota bacterium]|jgi:hypothetical protein